ncbi:acyltransferase [Epilithonimonas sp. JDS]|uniref:acyltransferase family protein n=1 Tax=Epilithonimonas sp. JDS TaxID=2902797 RepID=UPI001E48FD2A|nr:acyltransferase [Epilithonimonas sp. JDS]MCD9854640.1 acyltransferase [Epilithonimonas sp. JDS]
MKKLFRIEIDVNRIYGLDIMRFFAIMSVVISHAATLLSDKIKKITEYFAFDGVSIFFVLSGFLIGGILIKLINNKGINSKVIKNFWIRRWFRTIPNYFLILTVLVLLHTLYDPNFSFRDSLKYFYFSQNIYTPHPAHFFPEAWSLSVEEWFYLILPLLIMTLSFTFKGSQRTAILVSCLLIIVSVTLFRSYRYFSLSDLNISGWDIFFRKQVITRLDSLMFGVLAAYCHFYHYKSWIRHKKLLLVIGVALILFERFYLSQYIPISSFYACVLSFTLVSAATAMLLPFLNEFKAVKGGLLFRVITYISLISYSMYLINYTLIQKFMINAIPWEYLSDNYKIIMVVRYGFYWALVILMSILIYKYFEIPMTKMREKFRQR